MSFAKNTGKKRKGKCLICGLEITQYEYESWNRDGHKFKWGNTAHKAPCGAQCSGGGYEHRETDVHMPAFSPCPRCGESSSEVVKTIVNKEENERVVFHKYIIGREDYRIDHEILSENGWTV